MLITRFLLAIYFVLPAESSVFGQTFNDMNAKPATEAPEKVELPGVSQIAADDDGYADAPLGEAQHPRLLARYRKRPAWNVAGVDYATGYPQSVSLSDWQSLRGNGIVVDIGNRRVLLRDREGAVIDGVDFSRHGGAILYIERSPNTVVSNSNFGFKIANDFDTVSVIRADPASPNLAVTGCIIDGFADGGAGNQGNALIQSAAGGMLVMRHNWLKNSPSHVLEVSGGDGMILDYRFNLIENIGNNGSSGNHPNLLEWDASYASASRVVVSHNTVLQVPGPQGPGEAFQFYSNGGPAVDNVTFSRNVVIAAGDPAHVSISYILHGNNFVAGIYSKNGSIQDNYFDLSGAYGPFYGRSFNRGWVVARNWNMITGAPLLPAPR